MPRFAAILIATTMIAAASPAVAQDVPRELRIGRAGHAFDHLRDASNQAATAAASGSTIIYASGLGAAGYEGLPADAELAKQREAVSQYTRDAKAAGISKVIGYVCATSIVGLETFDKNWSPAFRAQFKTPPSAWLQTDRQGNALPSWYGGAYRPACMNNPDWRAYEHSIVRQQLDTGHDGIFFDNPTVHPEGCYCSHCMDAFAAFLEHEGSISQPVLRTDPDRIKALRQLAVDHPKDFLRFRSTIARDFVADMRTFARTIRPGALVTCNNSLNSPDVLFSQCRLYGYNISELTKAEDFVVVEDMVSQPRVAVDGQVFEYGSTYKQLHAISHGKPIVAVTLVGGDYHTAPHLVRLAMAEAAAHHASYLSWPTWPAEQRSRMSATIRPQADLLRRHEDLLNDSRYRADVRLLLPFRRWTETDQCTASTLAAALTRANVQYDVVSEDDFDLSPVDGKRPVFLVESLTILSPAEQTAVEAFRQQGGQVVAADAGDWLAAVQHAVGSPSLVIEGPPTVRAVVSDQPSRTVVQLYNLNVQPLSSFDDKVTPATNVALSVAMPFTKVDAVTIHAADEGGTSGPLKFTVQPEGAGVRLQATVPRLEISAIVSIEK